MKLKENYNQTLNACYLGYITQAIVNNFTPLLFVIFQRNYEISLNKIALLISFNFGVQLIVDLLAAKYADKMGYRTCMVAAHIFAAAGLIGLGILPEVFANSYCGILVAVILYAIGGGLIEVLVSPIVEACPTERKEAAMTILHSFYCWGHVFVIVISTIFFVTIGIEQWKILACFWALIPLFNTFMFSQVPVPVLVDESEGMTVRQLGRTGIFWILVVMMVCSGASEHAMSQWASAFAEEGLNVSKTMGDLLGPCFFASMMGVIRIFYAKNEKKIDLRRFMICSSVLCVGSYLLAALSPLPILSLLGCGMCGIAVGIMWPGSFCMAAVSCPKGGTAMYAFLALAGDIGSAAGPTVVGTVAEYFGGDMRSGLLAVMMFPVMLIVGILKMKKIK